MKVQFFDATLRDGSHAVKHQLTKDNIEDYCLAMDGLGMHTIVVGHGNGLGASSLQVGLSKLTDGEMLSAARSALSVTRLGVYMIPGFGTIHDNLIPAIEEGVEVFKIGCHCTEADTTKQHIEFLRRNHKETYGVLMMAHMASPERLLEECQKIESYGAQGVILMDSAGAFTPDMVKRVISLLYNNLYIKVGFHPHNNMGMAVGNAYLAIQEGATIIDGTLRGFGAGAGNCQLEDIIALLEKAGVNTGVNLRKILDVSQNVMPAIMKKDMGQDPISIISGQAGVFSAFKIHVLNAAKEFGVDPKDIFVELGRRKAVGGQEDMIVEVAQQIKNRYGSSELSYQLGSLL